MEFDHLLVRYGELTLKRNKSEKFVNALKDNVIKSLQTIEGTHVKGKRDRMYISLTEEADAQEVINRLTKIFGIKSISPVHKTSQELDEIKKLCVDLAQDFKPGETFKIDVKRVDKSFPMDTYALQRELGGAILQATEDISADVKQPDYNVRVEVRMDGVYVFTQIYEGVVVYQLALAVKHS